MPKKPVKPAPVPMNVVCDLCGLAWDRHPEEPTAVDCVGLLKAELARRPARPMVWSGSNLSFEYSQMPIQSGRPTGKIQ